jgi:predicted esterase
VTTIEIRTIAARTHGRFLVRAPDVPAPWRTLVGFHGYRESAAMHLTTLESIPGAEGWLLVAVQGLHRFYMKGGDVVASWMTKEDRELAISDNVEYVGRVLDAVRAEFPVAETVFIGFSQGVAMAFRAAAHFAARALIVAGADVPPDVLAGTAGPLPPVVYGRGDRDALYTAEMHSRNIAALERLGVQVERVTFHGGHELAPAFLAAVGRRLTTSEC